MTDQQALIRAFADYARTISARYDIGDVLYRLTDQVVEVLDVDGAGVSLGDADGALRFVTATDEGIMRIEEQQVTLGEGPCHDAFTSGDRVTSADLTAEDRWPGYTGEALTQGCRAVAGIPMLAGEQRVGALNLYVRRAREWPADELDIAQVLADMATGYIINVRTLSESERTTAQLQHALDSRVLVEQAKGILAERHGIATAAAFERLRAHARERNSKVHDVAQAVIDGSVRL
jgi:GAF domain-containing protein